MKAKKIKKTEKIGSSGKPIVEKPTVAFVLSLIGGILILVSGVVLIILSSFLSGRVGKIMLTESSYITLAGIAYPIAGLKIVLGILVMIGAVVLLKSASQRMAWSLIILIFSIIAMIVSIFPPGPMGLLGAILGILGGALALSWKAAKRN
jgi:hypothetical protein